MTRDSQIINLRGLPRPLPDDVVRIDRATRWGNPWKIGMYVDGIGKIDRAQAIDLFRQWLDQHLPAEPDFLEPLRGKRLACWCAPLPCHGDIILDYLGAVR